VSELLPTREQTTGTGDPRFSVIWLHGLGADGSDFVPIVPELGVDDLPIRFVFPDAPSIPVTINGGYVMPAWYDIRDIDLANRHDEGGIRDSHEQIAALLARENERGIPTERIALAGFSQGGAIALHTGQRHPERLAGLIALSTYLVMDETLATERHEANAQTPIFAAHGTNDPMVELPRGEAAKDRLLQLGHPIEWHTYPMQHQVCLEEIQAIGAFLNRIFAESD
jgi:phospholipase/carboxylesterase